jgi:hypothetical protein
VGDSYIPAEEDLGDDIQDRAYAMIDYIRSQIERGKRSGADFREIENLLMGAQMMVASGSYEDGMELINQCSQEAGQRLLDYDMLVKTIKRAEAAIENAEVGVKDTEEAKKHLKLARYHLQEGNYTIGIGKARAAIDSLVAKKEAEIAWGSGL